jgi:hypothetical protein
MIFAMRIDIDNIFSALPSPLCGFEPFVLFEVIQE